MKCLNCNGSGFEPTKPAYYRCTTCDGSGRMETTMDDIQFCDFLALMMCSDPWPDSVPKDALDALADEESQKRGYQSWIEAYHAFERPMENLPWSGSAP